MKKNLPSVATDHPWSETRVMKTIWPPRPGARMLCERYGTKLVCVRYRYSRNGEHRYTTVELLVDQGPVRHKGLGGAGQRLEHNAPPG